LLGGLGGQNASQKLKLAPKALLWRAFSCCSSLRLELDRAEEFGGILQNGQIALAETIQTLSKRSHPAISTFQEQSFASRGSSNAQGTAISCFCGSLRKPLAYKAIDDPTHRGRFDLFGFGKLPHRFRAHEGQD
jgi:hypothetical protein